MCKLCVGIFECWKKAEMHPRVKGFFKPVTAHKIPERLPTKTEQ